ncbi:unnamed protein product [Ectocarpus sp. CCAP 1310/34]|nr:unnamed protein product [Ectocarpus sp. CCAP 1310/34]
MIYCNAYRSRKKIVPSIKQVVCIDISRGFNTVNAKLSAAAGLSDKIIIPGERCGSISAKEEGGRGPFHVYQHIGISRLASPGLYEEWGKAYGLEHVEFDDRTSNFSVHYQHLVDVIASLRGTIKGVDDEFLDRMTSRYGSWCVAAEFDVLRWGVIVFKKSSTARSITDGQSFLSTLPKVAQKCLP